MECRRKKQTFHGDDSDGREKNTHVILATILTDGGANTPRPGLFCRNNLQSIISAAMSAASKYANLPFIASGERDIFETEDLPEADQIQQQQPLYDASVEIIPTGTVDAFQKFANAVNNESLKFEVRIYNE